MIWIQLPTSLHVSLHLTIAAERQLPLRVSAHCSTIFRHETSASRPGVSYPKRSSPTCVQLSEVSSSPIRRVAAYCTAYSITPAVVQLRVCRFIAYRPLLLPVFVKFDFAQLWKAEGELALAKEATVAYGLASALSSLSSSRLGARTLVGC